MTQPLTYLAPYPTKKVSTQAIDIKPKRKQGEPATFLSVLSDFSPKAHKCIEGLAARVGNGKGSLAKKKELSTTNKKTENVYFNEFEILIFNEKNSFNSPDFQSTPEILISEVSSTKSNGENGKSYLNFTNQNSAKSGLLAKAEELKQAYGFTNLSPDVNKLPIITNENQSRELDSIVRNAINYKWGIIQKPEVSIELLDKKLADCLKEEINYFFFIKKNNWNSYLIKEDMLVKSIVIAMRENNIFLEEIFERVNVLFSTLQMQILLLESQSSWTRELYDYLNKIFIFSKKEKNSLFKFNKIIETLQLEADEPIRELIFKAFGDELNQVNGVISYLKFWASQENESKLQERVKSQLRKLTEELYSLGNPELSFVV